MIRIFDGFCGQAMVQNWLELIKNANNLKQCFYIK